MNIKETHWAFKEAVNKNDSNQNRNFKTQEIDYLLNEAQDLYIRIIAQPRSFRHGATRNQRNIDAISELVISPSDTGGIPCSKYDSTSYIAKLPDDYKYLLRSHTFGDKDECKNKKLRCYQVQYDDVDESSYSYQPSFEWGEVNLRFLEDDQVRLSTDGTFSLRTFLPTYIRQPKRMHYADSVGGYRWNGEILTGTQNCELSDSACREIIDIAAYLATNNVNMPELKNKLQKIQLDEII